MIFEKKNRFKPLYKQFINLYENVQNRTKILQFKKQKWQKLISYIKRKSKRYKKFKTYNQTQYIVSRYPKKWDSYKRTHKKVLQTYKKFKLMYGNFTKLKIKNFITTALKKKKNLNNFFLSLFEHRLDIVLYRAKFCNSVRTSKQLITHGKILVNYKKINSQSYILKEGDLISINPKFSFIIERNIATSAIWPLPPKHLVINYKTLQIIFAKINYENVSSQYNFNLDLEKILIDLS